MLARGRFDEVIRIGNVPTLRFWRDVKLPTAHYTRLPFAGLDHGEALPLDALPSLPPPVPRDRAFFDEDRARAARLQQILDEEPQSELAMFRTLSRELPQGARIYIGNSLPIREWDLAATRDPRGFTIEANRGANGIDGQLSTFFGWCRPGADNIAILGDLTALYDLNAPWIVPRLEAGFRIIIINNGGGRIFSRVSSLQPLAAPFRERVIENAHALHFGDWARMFGIEITELTPDAEASRRVWARYDALWS
jgi:2-succinyl-5-enolpyruvyl-6-hydroxy-3-cyclohexene-1-carboxylate synthase